jgi:hypothetical protein
MPALLELKLKPRDQNGLDFARPVALLKDASERDVLP